MDAISVMSDAIQNKLVRLEPRKVPADLAVVPGPKTKFAKLTARAASSTRDHCARTLFWPVRHQIIHVHATESRRKVPGCASGIGWRKRSARYG